MVNFETIGGVIIECHLRFADQWVDLYGRGWTQSVVELYQRGRWRFADDERSTGYGVVLFGGHGLHYVVDRGTVEEIRALPDVSSVHITFYADRSGARHAARRFSPRHRQLPGSGGRRAGARAAGADVLVHTGSPRASARGVIPKTRRMI